MTAATLAPEPTRPLQVTRVPESGAPAVDALRWRPVGHRSRSLHLVQELIPVAVRVPAFEDEPRRQPTPASELPPAGPWATRLGVAILEVCAGSRPVSQLMRHFDAGAFDGLLRRQTLTLGRVGGAPRRRRPIRVRRVRVCEPAYGVAEATVVLQEGERIRALALRLEGLDGRWLVTAAEIG